MPAHVSQQILIKHWAQPLAMTKSAGTGAAGAGMDSEWLRSGLRNGLLQQPAAESARDGRWPKNNTLG